MAIQKNDLVKFRDKNLYGILRIPEDSVLIVVRGPYEGRHFNPPNTALSIVVDVMAGIRIIERIKTSDLEKC